MFRKFPSIEQFRNVVKEVAFNHKNEATLPTMTFHGTVKLHGTNACIGYNYDTMELFCQKRNGYCTVDNDNAGFAAWVETQRDAWINWFNGLVIDGSEVAYLYGEWCGSGIQKGVAISELPKMFVVFETVCMTNGKEEDTILNEDEFSDFSGVYRIEEFAEYYTTVDFNAPALVQNDLIALTEQVEAECPVAKHFGVSGVGEGIVWRCGDYRFKVKGEKHSVTKVKTLVEVDIEKVKTVNEFLDRAVTDNRLEQGLDYLRQENLDVEMKNIGTFLSWIFDDIVKEESDVIEASGLEKRDYSKGIALRAKKWYMEKMNNV